MWLRRGRENPLSAISWWKIFDNLRRSLVPIGLLILLLGGWLTLDRPLAAASALLAVVVVAAIPLMDVLTALVRKPRDVSLLLHLRLTARALGEKSLHVLFTLIFLASDAWISLDAIARCTGCCSVSVTKRKLLEWTTSSDAERSQRTDIPGFFRTMWLGPVIAAGVAFLFFGIDRRLPWFAIALLLAWGLSPLVAWWLSRPLAAAPARLLEKQRQFLQKLARRTWRYFEVFVTAEENWLPPDNVQERLSAVIAPRTSPTNIGIALLANLAAYDFGYCSAAQLLDRTAKTFQSLAKMERHRGHFLNWYDTRTLQPLSPRYVSMVDSGNLAGHLFVLRSGLAELIHAPIFPSHVFGGLRDTLGVLLDTALGQHCADQPRARASARHTANGASPAGLWPSARHTAHSALQLQRLLVAVTEIARAGRRRFRSAMVGGRPDGAPSPIISMICAPVADSATRRLPEGIWTDGSPEQIQQLTAVRQAMVRLDGPLNLREVAELGHSTLPFIDAVLSTALPEIEHAMARRASACDRWLVQLRDRAH